MDDVKRIELLAALLKEYDLDAVRIRVGESEIEVVRRSAEPKPPSASAVPTESAPVASATTKKITAPVVGVFYRSAAPGEEPFVEVGDRVEAGDTLCMLEAMKIFNEITTDDPGVVTRIIPENGELVALGDELFWIEP
jgi:acetyl-CoA carboxylase biotin carboxyl carrier protein